MRSLANPSIRRAAVMALLCAAALGAHGATKEVAGSGPAVIAGTNANGSANTNTTAPKNNLSAKGSIKLPNSVTIIDDFAFNYNKLKNFRKLTGTNLHYVCFIKSK